MMKPRILLVMALAVVGTGLLTAGCSGGGHEIELADRGVLPDFVRERKISAFGITPPKLPECASLFAVRTRSSNPAMPRTPRVPLIPL